MSDEDQKPTRWVGVGPGSDGPPPERDPAHMPPLTCHNEPDPDRPGVVRPVLDGPIWYDPETGETTW